MQTYGFFLEFQIWKNKAFIHNTLLVCLLHEKQFPDKNGVYNKLM